MTTRSCEMCYHFKIVPKEHRIYIRRPDAKLIVNCKENIFMAYHEYDEGADKYKTISADCKLYDGDD